jgi:predicted MFS family arabinose efflux permease
MSNDHHDSPGGKHWTRARERLLLLTLAAIQFTTILDFIIIIPLGPQYQRVFHIAEQQFQQIVSAYGYSAGVTGLLACFVLDRFDRKRALLWIYAGFTMGTLFCALSPTYHLLVVSRYIAGAFGGVCGTIVLSIVGDVVPMERRGAAMGTLMSAFSVSSIVGVPAGIFVADYYNWHVPFFAIAGIAAVTLVIAAIITPPLRGHLLHAQDEHPVVRTWRVMTHPDHLKAYVFMAGLTCGGFCIFTYIPDYMVKNVGFTQRQLSYIYLCGGICTVFTMNWVGRWADRAGKLKVFVWVSLSTAIPILLITNLPRVPLVLAICVSTLLMICMSGRMVPAMALMTGAVETRYRGGFMSINTAVQQFSISLTATFSSYIIGKGANGEITHFGINGLISIACALGCIYLARFLKAPAHHDQVAEPMAMEA